MSFRYSYFFSFLPCHYLPNARKMNIRHSIQFLDIAFFQRTTRESAALQEKFQTLEEEADQHLRDIKDSIGDEISTLRDLFSVSKSWI